MAIIKCPECGRQISDKAPTCPSCGVEIAGKITKCPNCGEVYFNYLEMCPNCQTPNPTLVGGRGGFSPAPSAPVQPAQPVEPVAPVQQPARQTMQQPARPANPGMPAASISPAEITLFTALRFVTARRIPSPVPVITAVRSAAIPTDAVSGQVRPIISATPVPGSV